MKKELGLPRSEISALIDEWILSEKARYAMKRRYLDGITAERIAAELEMSVRQTNRIIYKAEETL